ncbi:MAG TPA: sel1 repeat family protein, partial [Afipia sp.]
MRTSRHAVSFAWVALAIFAMTPIYAFDGTKDSQDAADVAVVAAPGGGLMQKPVPPADIPQPTALSTLQYAADDGHPAAQWKLGRMYADGIVVPRDDLRAFDYFSKIA